MELGAGLKGRELLRHEILLKGIPKVHQRYTKGTPNVHRIATGKKDIGAALVGTAARSELG